MYRLSALGTIKKESRISQIRRFAFIYILTNHLRV